MCRYFQVSYISLGDEKGMKKFITSSMTDTENSSSVAHTNKRQRGKSPSKETPVKKPRKEPNSKAAKKRYNYKQVHTVWRVIFVGC